MCLGIPGQIVEFVDREHHIAKADVSGVRRNVNVGLLAVGDDAVDVGDWVLIHVGFAMSKIDEDEARATRSNDSRSQRSSSPPQSVPSVP